MTVSISNYKEIAIAASSYRLDPSHPEKSIYLFEIVTDEINIVRESQRVSTLPAFKELRKRIFDKAIVIESPDGQWYNAELVHRGS